MSKEGRKSFSGEQSLTEFLTIREALQEILKGVLNVETNKKNGTSNHKNTISTQPTDPIKQLDN